tara:strand:+ start:2207 stop:2953 length:747 start_codon:yes stop_codon:yes gene_type:complete
MSENSSMPRQLQRKKKVIVVEDDEMFGRLLNYQLHANGYDAYVCSIATNLFDRIKLDGVPDLFVLDYFLGDETISGLDLCRKVKSYFDRPVIMLTGNDNVETTVSCLNAGAEQYIIKPCDIRELIARIEVTLRSRTVSKESNIQSFSLFLDDDISFSWEDECLIHTDGNKVKLTQKEIALLELILREPNRFVDRRKAFNVLYGYNMDPFNRSIDILIGRIRKKIRILDDRYIIKNLRGKGYLLCRRKE